MSCVCWKEFLRDTWIPTYKLPKLSGYAIRCWGYRGSIISHPNLQSLHPAVSILQHITKKPSEIIYLNLRKASVIRVMAILPNSRPSTGWRRGYLTNNCIKEIFDVSETKVFQNYNDKIVTTTPWSSTPRDTATTPKCQEAPRTMFSSQNHRNDSKIPAWS